MDRTNLDTKTKIIQTTKELLRQEADPDRITIRRIAERAGVSVGLINYHFQTRENLLGQAVADTMTGMEAAWQQIKVQPGADPLEKLKRMLKELSDYGAKYPKLMQFMVKHELLHGNFSAELYLIPVLREIFGKSKEELELKLIAAALVGAMQVALVKDKAFQRYSGIDIYNPKQRKETIDRLIDCLFIK